MTRACSRDQDRQHAVVLRAGPARRSRSATSRCSMTVASAKQPVPPVQLEQPEQNRRRRGCRAGCRRRESAARASSGPGASAAAAARGRSGTAGRRASRMSPVMIVTFGGAWPARSRDEIAIDLDGENRRAGRRERQRERARARADLEKRRHPARAEWPRRPSAPRRRAENAGRIACAADARRTSALIDVLRPRRPRPYRLRRSSSPRQ